MLEVICEVIFAPFLLIFSVLLLLFIPGLLGAISDYFKNRKRFANEFVYIHNYIRDIAEELEKMNEELEKTEKELTALIDNK